MKEEVVKIIASVAEIKKIQTVEDIVNFLSSHV